LEESGEIALIVASEIKKIGAWAKEHPDEAATILSAEAGLEAEKIKAALSRRSFEVDLVDDEAMAGQQAIADLFFLEKLLYQPLKVSEAAIWKPSAPLNPQEPAQEAQ
jgi:sulfonate transport system substrate-binding protein